MKRLELWPPLSQIRGEISGEPAASVDAGTGGASSSSGAPATPSDAALEAAALRPLEDWLRRRGAAQGAPFATDLASGHVLGWPHQGKVFGVLLDHELNTGLWQGWLTAPEADWAGPYDVLLEPDDEPFDPLCGVVQAWNPVQIQAKRHVGVMAVLGQTRLGAIRQVQQEAQRGATPASAPQPGCIALRSLDSGQTVLTGTPLAPDDPRHDYQALYRQIALDLS